MLWRVIKFQIHVGLLFAVLAYEVLACPVGCGYTGHEHRTMHNHAISGFQTHYPSVLAGQFIALLRPRTVFLNMLHVSVFVERYKVGWLFWTYFLVNRQKAEEPDSGSQRSQRSCEHFVHEGRDVQLAESTDWASVFGVRAAATLGALVLVVRALLRNQDN